MFRDKLAQRIAHAEADRAAHAAANRGVEVLAANIRIQALKEALALWDGKELPPNEMVRPLSDRSAERPVDRVVHVNRGGTYTVLTREGVIQTDQPLQDNDRVAIYIREGSGVYVARRACEMGDGRFRPA